MMKLSAINSELKSHRDKLHPRMFFDFRPDAIDCAVFKFIGVISLLTFGFWGCATIHSPPEPLMNAAAPLTIPTYDGSGQLTEPDVIFFNSHWHGFQYWMAFSPYPFTNPAEENPSIVVSNDGVNWQVPDGLVNPLVLPVGMNYRLCTRIRRDPHFKRLSAE
jgi:hypothetical protein